MECSFDGCDKPVFVKASGLCGAHYEQRRRGTPLKPLRARSAYKQEPALCAFEGCDRQARTAGLCNGHYAQQLKGKPLTPLRERRPQSRMTRDLPCEFLECDRTQYSKGLCTAHYEQQRRGSPLTPIRPIAKQ